MIQTIMVKFFFTIESVVKRIHKLTKKAPKSPRLTNTDLEDSDDDDEEKEPVVKKVSKFLGLAETSSESSGDPDTKDNPRAMGFPINKSLEAGKNEEEPVHKKKGFAEVKKYHMLQNLILTTLKKC